jgi:hypothetical protein
MTHAHFRFLVLSATLAFIAPTVASAGDLQLSAGGTIDISGLNIASVGDMTVQDERIWLADGTTNGLVYAIDTDGDLLDTISPTVIPGLTNGPDAMCGIGATGLILFSSFGQSVAGRMTWTTSTLNATYPSAEQATAAEFGSGLWIASGTTAGVGSTLKRLDTSTGAVLQELPIPALTVRIADLARDPLTGAMYALCEDDQLRGIDLATGAIVSVQNLAPFLIGHNSVAGGMDFNTDGSRLYIAYGAGAGSDSVIVLERAFSASVCGNGIGAFTCPCGNTGANGRGCTNSLSFNLGGFLSSVGIPKSSADTFVLGASGLPPGTFVLFFQSTGLNTTPPAFGDGVLCAAGTITRLSVEAAASGVTTCPGAGDPPLHVQGQIGPGSPTVFYQGWYRDSAAFCTTSTFNLTNALRVEWGP